MAGKDISGKAPGGKRVKLADALPLATPFVVQVFPVYACNFKCSYCIFSIPKSKRGFISDKVNMDFNLYRKSAHEMTHFPDRIKVLRFVGIGEPLLHKRIVDMIRLSSELKIADTIEILTNGALLKPELTDALVDAGLNRMVVSIQGTSGEKYREVSGVDIDFDEFIQNLDYYYRNKGDSHIYIKVVDTALDGDEDKQRFYDIYGKVCDTIAVEHTVPIHHGIEYDKILGDDQSVTQFGLPLADVKVCPQPFFTMQINPDGNIVPCYSFEYPEIVGNCNEEDLFEIWSSRRFNEFRMNMLEGSKEFSPICRECSIIKYRIFPEDDLNDHAERLKPFYEGRTKHKSAAKKPGEREAGA